MRRGVALVTLHTPLCTAGHRARHASEARTASGHDECKTLYPSICHRRAWAPRGETLAAAVRAVACIVLACTLP